MKRTVVIARRAFSLALIAALSAVAPSAANSRPVNCSTSGYALSGYVYYASSGLNWNVSQFTYRLSGGSVRHGNNANLRVRRGTTVIWAWNSPDDRVNDNRQYSKSVGVYVSKTAAGNGQITAIFDKNNAGDPSCTGTGYL